MNKKNYLAWIDLEMTGLNPECNRIIEAALIITDENLNPIDEGLNLAIHQSDELLASMDEWNTSTHTRTGLIDRVRTSTITEEIAENLLLEKLSSLINPKITPLCGNSVHQDRRFLVRYMPKLEDYFHYRNLDVSTLKELARRWNPPIYRGINKQGAHRALDDIMESIAEMRYYRDHFLKLPENYENPL